MRDDVRLDIAAPYPVPACAGDDNSLRPRQSRNAWLKFPSIAESTEKKPSM